MSRSNNLITPETLIPLSVLGAVCGGVAWLSAMHMDLTHANAEIANFKTELSSMVDNQRGIDRRLSKMEGQLDFIVNHIEAKNMSRMLKGQTP